MSKAKVNINERFTFGETLGSGSFATVVSAVDNKTNVRYAMKIIDKNRCRGQEDHIVKEITILKSIKHKNCIQLYDVFETKNSLYLQMEYVDGGELFDRIVNLGFYSEGDAKNIVLNILTALDYIHGEGIVHRDLKPENLLMASKEDNAEVKLADFGLASVATNDYMLKTNCGSLTYIAPEVLKSQPYGKPVDMWGIGVITYILLSGYPPFWAEDDAGIMDITIKGIYKFFSPDWDNITDDAKDFIAKLLIVNPDSRMTSSQALKHKWLTDSTSQTVDISKTVGDNLVKNFNYRRKLKAGIDAVMVASGFVNSVKKETEKHHSDAISAGLKALKLKAQNNAAK
ncbi:calcium/calmodulin-dependent protein kinase type 1D-like protein [Polychytrium aggregatum]|uniref:calcium/calmodulin-dependent protein kinase type 1D-like protein n=1 Tax=Polychytrium aggregatum TaxID=110093 RepID=UPI0022FEED69|nr:calcium/calmodulin-dependent protein kinase type 1D-like protein [Polychytrium aggregatum]KAI9203693.1 calcium/calmodulin-dependent protein kinase type 1D-like protein [Polychytrium aggregatum]